MYQRTRDGLRSHLRFWSRKFLEKRKLCADHLVHRQTITQSYVQEAKSRTLCPTPCTCKAYLFDDGSSCQWKVTARETTCVNICVYRDREIVSVTV